MDAALEGIITVFALGVVLGAIGLFGWLVRASGEVPDGGVILRRGPESRGLAVMILVIAVGFAVLPFAVPTDGRAEILGFAAGVAAVAACLGFEAFRRQIVMNDVGLLARGWFGTAELIRWTEIVSVENIAGASKFVVRTHGRRLTVGHNLVGVIEFAEECRKRLAPEVYGRAFGPPPRRFLGGPP